MKKIISVGAVALILGITTFAPTAAVVAQTQPNFGTSETSVTDINGVATGGNSNTPTGGNSNTPTGGNSGTNISVMNALPNPLNGVNSLSDLVYKIVNVVVDISYVVIAFFLLLSGFKFITAQGSDSKLEEAKKTFFYTIIGALLIIGAQVIVSIVQGIFRAFNS